MGTSLLAVGTFGLATALRYASDGLVDWSIAAQFILGGVAGGAAGTLLATRLAANQTILTRIFAALVLLVAGYVIAKNFPQSVLA